MKCRVCESVTTLIVDFGKMPIANDFREDNVNETYRFNLAAIYCSKCYLIQLSEQPEPTLMFHDEYRFFTGLSSYMSRHFRNMVLSNIPSDYSTDYLISEIGCNDGTLLSNVAQLGIKHVGIDPSHNVVNAAKLKGVNAEAAFFSEQTSVELVKKYGKADLILAANVICHIPDINDIARGIKSFLKPEGKFIFEEPYIGSMIEKVSYDQLYDEHVFIFGALSVQRIFEKHGLTLVACEPQITHGGSMRYTLMHEQTAKVQNSVPLVLEQERLNSLDELKTYLDFGKKCETRKSELVSLLKDLNKQGKKVAGYAATSKSTTVLNYCKIDSSLITHISDSTPEKIGTFTPGSHIPIISHEEMRANPPDFLVLFAWNHEKEILQKESGLLDKKVKWIRFIPEVEIVN